MMNDWEMMRDIRDAYWRARERGDTQAEQEALGRAESMGFINPGAVSDEIVKAFGQPSLLNVRGAARLRPTQTDTVA
ncbi:MAG: hypothetical protein COY40_03730 [Alphaproteobacteria bacterium CG_4_10_14_0_8_um_filter_53_9]|nr:MAG: hypothetical protein COY40_03730 [Alphaproteobacteria bacterium CG_4_10_14_0_8_um_filter_53_9]